MEFALSKKNRCNSGFSCRLLRNVFLIGKIIVERIKDDPDADKLCQFLIGKIIADVIPEAVTTD